MKDYKINTYIQADDELTDSIVPHLINVRKNLKIVPKEYLKYYDYYPNIFRYVSFLNDSILAVNSNISYWLIPENNSFEQPTHRRGSAISVIFWENLNTRNKDFAIMKHLIEDEEMKTFAQCYSFAIDKKNNIIYTITTNDEKSISTAAYDFKGNFLHKVFGFPTVMTKNSLMTRITYTPEMVLNNKNELLLLFPFIPKVINSKTYFEFPIESLKYDNSELLDRLNTDFSYEAQIKDSIFSMLRYKNKNIWLDNNDNIIIHYNYTEKNTSQNDGPLNVFPFIRIYNQAGKLIAEKELLYRNEAGKLSFIHFDKGTNIFYFFRKGSENWTVEECKWGIK